MAYYEPIKELGETPLVAPGETFHSSHRQGLPRHARTRRRAGGGSRSARRRRSRSSSSRASATCSGAASASGETRSPVYWAWDITNFVWWVGIGHAGTLISAILFLFRQKWRTAINRFAEAMTIFAVICALIFPGIHVGRPWFAYYMFPLPNQMTHLAELQEPAAVGRLRGQHVLHGLAALLVRRASSRTSRRLRDRATTQVAPARLRLPRPRLARHQPPLAELRARVPDPRRALDAARALRAQRRLVRLRDVGHPRLAHDDLPALLRRRRRLQRLRDGHDAAAHRARRSTG